MNFIIIILIILIYGYYCEIFFERMCCFLGFERNREVDESKENDGRSFLVFLGLYLLFMYCKICEFFLGFLLCCIL